MTHVEREFHTAWAILDKAMARIEAARELGIVSEKLETMADQAGEIVDMWGAAWARENKIDSTGNLLRGIA